MAEVPEEEVPKCGEELVEDGRCLGLLVNWQFVQVIVSRVVISDSSPNFEFAFLPLRLMK